MEVKVRTALISVSDKTGIVGFARGLADLGVKIISTGGTARQLQQAKIPVIEVETITGLADTLDGRVKTLHPKIHAGILALRDKPSHMHALQDLQAEQIDLVCVNLYPFEQTTARPECTLAEAIEDIDIGGPALIRAAAKNFRFVTVVTRPDQYPKVLDAIQQTGGVPEQVRAELAREAFALTSCYDTVIARYLNLKAGVELPEQLTIPLRRQMLLRYGENPHQSGGFYTLTFARETSISKGRFICNDVKLSFNNLLDANAAFELVKEFDEPAAAIVKHLNPCGCGVDEDIKMAYRKAYEGDVVSAFGGIIAVNRPVDPELGRWIMESYSRFGKVL
ncbi:MAG: bifunctional phosphoribosylaminoimidazolecarboxamide formyltransferase/IMP cyclohydrolase, partial [Sedimentisphaerales bacterium]|nr:bifunctional phosphoribosylaminoimidazolecarboxamide formyltransferase/IMP cyclohydrolase [Sedimentisphaerales bacterium]